VSSVRDEPRPRGKKAVNLSIDAALLHAAREQHINLSATLERALSEALRQGRQEQWLVENQAGIDAYNEQVGRHGAFADTLRSF